MDSETGVSTAPLPGSDEPPPVELVNAGGRSSAVLVCDHASNGVPRQLGSLGLDAIQLADHIGWDPGAAAVARRLSTLLDAPLVVSGYPSIRASTRASSACTGRSRKKGWRTSRVRQGPAPPTKRPDKGVVDLTPSSRTQTVTR
jgi:hypothetical protein